jgi:hypothetical protein
MHETYCNVLFANAKNCKLTAQINVIERRNKVQIMLSDSRQKMSHHCAQTFETIRKAIRSTKAMESKANCN